MSSEKTTDGKRFDDPQRVAINRVYTRKGDDGATSLVGGQRLPKHDLRIEAYGAVDELNSFVGVARQSVSECAVHAPAVAPLDGALNRVQHELFNLGSILATLPADVHPKQPRVTEDDVARLEGEMDACNAQLEPLRSFVLPGGSRLNAELHVCRTVCRRAERAVSALCSEGTEASAELAYLNRLSDAFFVWSRWVIAVMDGDELLWDPNWKG